MKKIIFVLSILYCGYVQAQSIVPLHLKDSAVKSYIKMRELVENNTYQASTDPYFPVMSKCLSYCKTKADSLYFGEWILKKYHEYKRDLMNRP